MPKQTSGADLRLPEFDGAAGAIAANSRLIRDALKRDVDGLLSASVSPMSQEVAAKFSGPRESDPHTVSVVVRHMLPTLADGRCGTARLVNGQDTPPCKRRLKEGFQAAVPGSVEVRDVHLSYPGKLNHRDDIIVTLTVKPKMPGWTP